MPKDPNDPRPSHPVQIRVTGQMRGLDVTLTCEVDVRKLDASLRYLVDQGLEPTPRPLVFDTTPDGKPVCPRHKTPMQEREKQGDRWFSHRVLAPDGEELWCRGYAGPESPGFAVDRPLSVVPPQQPAATVGHPAGCRSTAPEATRHGAPSKPQTPPRPARPPRRRFGDGVDN